MAIRVALGVVRGRDSQRERKMRTRKYLIAALWVFFETCALQAAITVEGAPGDAGFNVGSVATLRGSLRGVSGDASRFVMFADIQYLGTTAVSSVQLDR